MDGMNLQDASGQFQTQLLADGRSLHTRRQYGRHLRSLITWLEQRRRPRTLRSLTPSVVAEFFASEAANTSARGGAKKATSTNAMRTSIRCFCRWAHESGLIASNPARLLRRARCAAPPPKALRADEQERLLAVLAEAEGEAAARDRMLIELLLGSGIRIGSALALNIEDVDLDHAEVTLRTAKGDRPATAVLPKAVVDALRDYIGERRTGPLFLADDRRVSMRHAQRRIGGWFEAAGITGRSAHSLRHAFATRLLERTGDLRLVQVALNHASIVSTTIYASIQRDRVRAAVGA